jgi:hypothetical protein
MIEVFQCFKRDPAFASWTRLQKPTWWEHLFFLLNRECDIEDSNGLNIREKKLEGKTTLFDEALAAPIFAERSFTSAPGLKGARGPLRSRLCHYSPQSHTELWRQEWVYLQHSSSAELKFIQRFALVLTPKRVCELIFDLHLENCAATLGGAVEVWRDLQWLRDNRSVFDEVLRQLCPSALDENPSPVESAKEARRQSVVFHSSPSHTTSLSCSFA